MQNPAFIDLYDVPFTVPKSRFLLRYEEDPAELKTEDQTLDLYYVRYEVPLQECLVARLPAGEIEIGWGFVRSAEWELAICENSCSIQLLNASAIEWVDLANIELHQLADSLRIFGNDFLTAESLQQTHLEFQKIADTYVREWMEKSPRVLTCRQEMTDFCWWVLGANQIALKIGENATMRTIVVPSMLGYVGLWQWDAYFIALGLQHGDIELAIAQLEIAFSPEPDGQLPDVVHEKGRLASSLDLPPCDLVSLRERGNLRYGEVVPLTKPPLGAWAAKQIIAELPPQQRAELMRKWYPILLANQQWWMRAENCDELGRPQYLHPYSSGLDDSPVFDASGAVVSPDLLAYLIVQEQILREWAAEIGVECPLDNLPQLRRWLADLWDDEQGAYFAQNHAGVRQYRTILSLLGCFAPGIDSSRLRQLSADIENPERFHARWPLPTVAQDDPSFAENTMWRGPTWVNTTYLVADGLESNGELELAAKLRESTLEMFAVAGGPVEYVNSRSGTRCRTATTCFGWSAALYIDLAVREKNENALGVSFTSPM